VTSRLEENNHSAGKASEAMAGTQTARKKIQTIASWLLKCDLSRFCVTVSVKRESNTIRTTTVSTLRCSYHQFTSIYLTELDRINSKDTTGR